jgi:hypothetical protein
MCTHKVGNIPIQIKPVSFVTTGAMIEIKGDARKAISNAFFSAPLGRRERRDGIMKSHQNQYPSTWIEMSLHEAI